jgi:hypothetical protein
VSRPTGIGWDNSLPGAVIGVGNFHGNDTTDAGILYVYKYRIDGRIQVGVQRQVFVDGDRKRIIGQERIGVARRIFVARNQHGKQQQNEAIFFILKSLKVWRGQI